MEEVDITTTSSMGSLSGGVQKKNEDDNQLEEQSAGSTEATAASVTADDDDEEDSTTYLPAALAGPSPTTKLLEMDEAKEEEEEEDGDYDANARISHITTTTAGTVDDRSHYASSLHDRVRELVSTHDEAWLMLATRLGLSRQEAIETTSHAGMGIFLLLAKHKKKEELATHLEEEEHLLEMLTWHEEDELLEEFRDNYLLDSDNGVLELFRRSMFTTFDVEKKGVLGKESIMQWLDHTYSINPSMRGHQVFPPRVILETKLMNKLRVETTYKKKDGLSYDDMKTCILTEASTMESAEHAEEKSFGKHSSFNDGDNSERLQHILSPEHQEQLDHESEGWCFICSWIENLFSGMTKTSTTTSRTGDDNMEMVPISNEHTHNNEQHTQRQLM